MLNEKVMAGNENRGRVGVGIKLTVYILAVMKEQPTLVKRIAKTHKTATGSQKCGV